MFTDVQESRGNSQTFQILPLKHARPDKVKSMKGIIFPPITEEQFDIPLSAYEGKWTKKISYFYSSIVH